jgi:hypothetical protein
MPHHRQRLIRRHDRVDDAGDVVDVVREVIVAAVTGPRPVSESAEIGREDPVSRFLEHGGDEVPRLRGVHVSVEQERRGSCPLARPFEHVVLQAIGGDAVVDPIGHRGSLVLQEQPLVRSSDLDELSVKPQRP